MALRSFVERKLRAVKCTNEILCFGIWVVEAIDLFEPPISDISLLLLSVSNDLVVFLA